MVLVALDVAAPALESWRRLEHVPQGLGAGLAVGGEVVKRGDELVTLVADVGLLAYGQRLQLLLPLALSFIGIQDLREGGGDQAEVRGQRSWRSYAFTNQGTFYQGRLI